MKQIPEAIGSGPFKLRGRRAHPRLARRVRQEHRLHPAPGPAPPASTPAPRSSTSTASSGTYIPDPATASAALQQGEVDWWENPQLDLLPQIKTYKDVIVTVKDRTGEMGCLRFNQLFPPFNNPAIRRVVVAAMDQKEVMEGVAGAEPSLYRTDIGLFVPGTPMASTVGVDDHARPKETTRS